MIFLAFLILYLIYRYFLGYLAVLSLVLLFPLFWLNLLYTLRAECFHWWEVWLVLFSCMLGLFWWAFVGRLVQPYQREKDLSLVFVTIFEWHFVHLFKTHFGAFFMSLLGPKVTSVTPCLYILGYPLHTHALIW